MEKHEIAAILSDTRYYYQNKNGDRLYDVEWQFKNGFLGFLPYPWPSLVTRKRLKDFRIGLMKS